MNRELIFWYDLETTGLNPKIHGITELAFLIEVKGKVVEEYNFKVKPPHNTVVDPVALEKQGIDVNILDTYTPLKAVYGQFINILKKYVSPYKKHEKFVQAGYNIAFFDDAFLRGMFRSQGDKYYGSWFFPAQIDVLTLVGEWIVREAPQLENYRLTTVCKHFGIEFDAHKAINDVKATRELYYKLKEV